MSNVWQLQEAKNKFSNLVDRAQDEGPQFITKHGKESVVILSIKNYQKITKPKSNLLNFLRCSPLAGIAPDIQRDKSPSRDLQQSDVGLLNP
ncbi:MAG: type II toxin-antitoxin system Phd/YefM family antitoxin [Desulfobacterium sp.]|nr:type II toxin-antitoxin system Phd/YefM family antitoxin [Desulfobacterium sp.]MBU3947949.1 type II toxin-antitoxin system Phd/YefM family antitoxin [Pseudomonadota bacterium]MBU4010577.1 type II toxin-antitoxin system Phd/YefM family antitoxin [Pseudomonadota bacterium]MBU4037121.1 type II toxin-antitoxin system Phd/YefM family antitoxin [Pseudomonadota bacterium]